jgi:hypothetical protein
LGSAAQRTRLLNTAKAFGLEVPMSMLLPVDEVIE